LSSYYKTPSDTLLSFSGGRTSAYMLYRVLDAYDGKLPDHFQVCFSNTGKEMPETLDFVRDCEEKWDVPITWLEYDGRTRAEGDENNTYSYKIVDYATAARNGEPFERLIDDIGQLPNPMTRWCSGQLKVRTIHRYLKDVGFETPYLSMLGLRADEPRRAMRLSGKVTEGSEKVLPLYWDGVTKEQIGQFWADHEFDLKLPNRGGVNDWGNCDLCFLKGMGIRKSLIEQRPDLVDWWIAQEKKVSNVFNAGSKSYSELAVIATGTLDMFSGADESLPCFCGD